MMELMTLAAVLPSAGHDAGRSGHTLWLIILALVALIVATPLAIVFGRNRGRPGS
jgi:hypothetical protein